MPQNLEPGISKNLLKFVGNMPLIDIGGVYAKAEFLNPSGSIKDRLAKYIIKKAEKEGLVDKDTHVVEASTGNSGIAFAMVCAVRNYKFSVIMPKGLTNERVNLLKSLGAGIIYVKHSNELMKEAIELEEKYSCKKKHFAVKQFDTVWNVECYRIMGEEISKQIDNVDAFVCGVGTGGSLIGAGGYLKEKMGTKLFAVEPSSSPILSKGTTGKHIIEGIGDGIIPGIIERNRELIDGVIRINDKEAMTKARVLAKKYGLLCGVSSGANVLAAEKLKKKGFKNVVTILPDRSERYLSLGIYGDAMHEG